MKPAFAADRFALGEGEYNWALRNNLRVDRTAAQLYEDAWSRVERRRTALVDAARALAAERRWTLPEDAGEAVRLVLDRLAARDRAAADEVLGWYRDAVLRLVEFGERAGLFDVPAGYPLEVAAATLPQGDSNSARYVPAAPLSAADVGRLLVPRAAYEVDGERRRHPGEVMADAAREVFPGRDWYFKVLRAGDRVSPVRWLMPGAVDDSSSMWAHEMAVGGWGLYAAALVAEPAGAASGGVYSPEELLFHLREELLRDVAAYVDVGLHTGRLAYDEAVTLVSGAHDFLPGSCGDPEVAKDEVKQASCAHADRIVYRTSTSPTRAVAARLGQEQIVARRESAAARSPAAFSLEAFHRALIGQGTVPVGYYRDYGFQVPDPEARNPNQIPNQIPNPESQRRE